jgi:hypothetical protein
VDRLTRQVDVSAHLRQGAAERRGLQRGGELPMGKDGKSSERRTATLTKEQVAELERIAKRDHVSVSWLLRKGVELLIDRANEGPLLPGLVGGVHEQD